MENIKLYFWFIKESQKFMKGYNPIIVFIQSIYKGFRFVKISNEGCE